MRDPTSDEKPLTAKFAKKNLPTISLFCGFFAIFSVLCG